jgi:hypothetical protein
MNFNQSGTGMPLTEVDDETRHLGSTEPSYVALPKMVRPPGMISALAGKATSSSLH